MSVENPLERTLVVENGGWPTWGSDNVIFFHRMVGDSWGVYRADISNGPTSVTHRVTPADINAFTPAAIDATKVAVATIHGGKRIGYHRCRSDDLKSEEDIKERFHKLKSPNPDVGLFRVSGAFPSFSKDGSKLAFVDNEFKSVWIADSKGLRVVFETKGPDNIFSPVWNQNPEKDILYPKEGVPKTDNDLDPGYFAVFLAKVPKTKDEPPVVVRVVASGIDLAGHVNHPFFSPDGKSIVVTADLAAVSVDPISLPFLEHSVRPYGDIFTIDINPDDIKKNKNVKKFKRITHTRFENSTASWTMFPTQDPNAAWNKVLNTGHVVPCPYYAQSQGGESWHMTGLLCIPKRCC
ncbi:Tricorn protease [Trema orientale]|uniref:Tricorn protease n=1 Tax=Trema orientale TaxID=63057 RepID=A0A2P5EAM0_TREOI|nr:Tricorn protease [Trema orientale]